MLINNSALSDVYVSIYLEADTLLNVVVWCFWSAFNRFKYYNSVTVRVFVSFACVIVTLTIRPTSLTLPSNLN